MNQKTYLEKISAQTRPLVVEFWAAWCAPCNAMAPALAATANNYQGKVDLLKIDVDKNPDIGSAIKIMAVPTLVGYASGKVVFRKTGFQSPANIDKLFDDLAEGRKNQKLVATPFNRIIRLVAGTALIFLGAYNKLSILLIIAGGILAFSAVYDRCPIYRAVSSWIKSTFSKKPAL